MESRVVFKLLVQTKNDTFGSLSVIFNIEPKAFMAYILQWNLSNIQNNAAFWAKFARL